MKTLKYALLFAFAAFAVAACSRKPIQPQFGASDIDTLIASPGGVMCRVGYRYAPILNASASPALQAVEEANIGYFFELEGFTGTAREAAEATLREIAAEFAEGIPAGSVGADYEISVEAEGGVTDTLITYTITRASYTGGAHGIYGIECHTYSLESGYELTAADLLGAERLPRVGERIRARLYEQYEAANDEELTGKGFFPENIAVTDNFCVTSEGVTFIYNPYEIGCYALGLVEVTLTKEELDELGKP